MHIASTESPHKETIQDRIEKMVPRFVNKLKLCTRSCLMLFSSKNELPTELDKLLNILNRARVVSIKMNSNQPTIERADKLEELMSEALFHARKFRGVNVGRDVYARVDRMKRLMTPGVGMARALIRALEDTISDSEDDSDNEDDLTDSDSDSEGSSSNEETDSEDDLETGEEEMVSDLNNPSHTMQCTVPSVSTGKLIAKLPLNSQVQAPMVEHVQQDISVSQEKTQPIVMPYAPPRRPEDCKTKLSRDLSKLLWETRRKIVDKQAKGHLNFTRKNCTQGFKNQRSHIHCQLKARFSTSGSKKLSVTSGSITSLIGDLVKTTKSFPSASKPRINTSMFLCPQSQSTEKPKGTYAEIKSVISEVSKQVQPIMSTEDLANNSSSSVKYELSKSMKDISEQLSRSSISDTVSTYSSNVGNNAFGAKDIKLKDGPVKFSLRSSPLTAVLEQRKKGQCLVLPSFIQNCSTGQLEAGEDRKINPIKGSRLTALVKDEATVHHHAKNFANKMQQTLSHQLRAAGNIPPIRQMPGRVILTARNYTKKSLYVKTKLLSTNNTLPSACLINHSTSRGHILSLGTSISMIKPGHEESTTRVVLGKVILLPCIYIESQTRHHTIIIYFSDIAIMNVFYTLGALCLFTAIAMLPLN